jgi:hypothetical protein
MISFGPVFIFKNLWKSLFADFVIEYLCLVAFMFIKRYFNSYFLFKYIYYFKYIISKRYFIKSYKLFIKFIYI